jgi:oxygen-independent coproporphyrinogen-3 oxidase
MNDDLTASQFEVLVHDLERSGYEQYEVSNFSKPGFRSKHNSSYWKQEKYLGVGPGAHSYNRDTRQFNIKNNALYIASLQQNNIPFEREVLRHEDRVNEYLLTTLRTSWGTDLRLLKNDFNYDVIAAHEAYIKRLLDHKFAVIENDFLKLTQAGKLLADKISSDLFLEC